MCACACGVSVSVPRHKSNNNLNVVTSSMVLATRPMALHARTSVNVSIRINIYSRKMKPYDRRKMRGWPVTIENFVLNESPQL